jgi:hypothetical protein
MSVFVFSAQDTFAQSKKKRKADKDAPVKVNPKKTADDAKKRVPNS